MNLLIPLPSTKEDLFEVELEPIVMDEQRLRDLGVGKQEVIKLRGKKNMLAVGRPQCIDALKEFKKHNENLSDRTKNLINDFDFHLVVLSCSFRPEEGCTFEDARLSVSLNGKTKEGQVTSIRPIAYDTFPDRLVSETKVNTKIGFTSDIKISMPPFEVGGGSEGSREREFIIYNPEIYSFGIGTSDVSWDFSKTRQNALVGDKKNLLMVVQTPKDSNVTGRFILGAKISSELTKFIPIPVSAKRDRIIDEEHIICNC